MLIFNGKLSADALQAAFNILQTVAKPPRILDIDAFSIIGHFNQQGIFRGADINAHGRGLGMLQHIIEGFFDGQEEVASFITR